MKVYLAARYSRRVELCEYREQIRAAGHEVTSRWLDGDHQIDDKGEPIGESGERLVEIETPPVDYSVPERPDVLDAERLAHMRTRAAELRCHFAEEDLQDVLACDVLIAFTETPRSVASRGGRHVELGIAIGAGKTTVVCGPAENVFCWLPQVAHFDSWGSLVDAARGAGLLQAATE